MPLSKSSEIYSVSIPGFDSDIPNIASAIFAVTPLRNEWLAFLPIKVKNFRNGDVREIVELRAIPNTRIPTTNEALDQYPFVAAISLVDRVATINYDSSRINPSDMSMYALMNSVLSFRTKTRIN